MLISCVLQCTDGLRLIKRLENYAYRMSEKTAYRSLEKSAYRSLKKLLTVHLQIHLTACTDAAPNDGLLAAIVPVDPSENLAAGATNNHL